MATSPGTSKFDHLVKLLVIGDSGVGKSCLLLRYSDDSFTGSFITTIGIDFKIKAANIGGKRVKLQIWDTAGQERFRTITTAYYRGAMGILLVYDVSDPKSFRNVKNWIQQIERHAAADVNTILIGNKCDVEERAVTYEQGEELAREFGVRFFEASAKEDINVAAAFETIAEDVVTRLETTDIAALERSTVNVEGFSGKKRTGRPDCC